MACAGCALGSPRVPEGFTLSSLSVGPVLRAWLLSARSFERTNLLTSILTFGPSPPQALDQVLWPLLTPACSNQPLGLGLSALPTSQTGLPG